MKYGVRKALIGAGILLAVATSSLLYFYFSHVTTVQRKSSADGKHAAKLLRYDSIDVNFEVVIDGEKVFRSADFAPVKFDFREQINWDASGDIVILEVAGQRLFGYNARQKRRLNDGEIVDTKYAPFSEFGFEGLLPGQTKQ